jgi:transposase
MMGMKQRVFEPLPNLSLEELVPEDNFYRRLESTLDLSFVRDLVKDCYVSSGRPSVDAVVFFRLQLVMFFEDIRSERQLMEVAADRLSIRWYLGYDLNEPLPDHSSLTRIRERYGLSVFRCFFERIVELCVEAGLVWGKELYFHAPKIEASAALDSMRSRPLIENRFEGHLAEIFPQRGVWPAEVESMLEIPIVGPAGSERETINHINAGRHRWIASSGRQQREVVSTTYRDTTPTGTGKTVAGALLRYSDGSPESATIPKTSNAHSSRPGSPGSWTLWVTLA